MSIQTAGKLKSKTKARQYLINLQRWRSIAALFALLLTLGCSVAGLASTLLRNFSLGKPLSDTFRYFTNLSNVWIALTAAFIIPYAVAGIRKKRFVYPRWLALMHLAGVIATTLTCVFALTFIMQYDRYAAVGGSNLFLHVLSPILILVSFLLVESGHSYTFGQTFLCLIPTVLYTVVYLVAVVLIGKENGGWEDLYLVNTYLPFYVSYPLGLALASAIALAVRFLFNRVSRFRRGRLLSAWRKDMEPVEVNIEIYGLGRFYGLHGEKTELEIPYDILEALSDRYGMRTDALFRVYIKGMLDGIRDSGPESAQKKNLKA